MAMKRLRSSGTWEFVVRRKGLLSRPVSMTFDTEAEGDREVAKIEAMLARGVIPDGLVDSVDRASGAVLTVMDAIRGYQKAVAVPESDKPMLYRLGADFVDVKLSSVNYDWVESLITSMKHERKLAPTTIKHYIGALSRCLDWCVRKNNVAGMQHNPVKMLRRGYATYTDHDAKAAGVRREDQERERRVSIDEEAAILKAVDAAPDAGRLRLMFVLAIETAMRMREIYTLTADQIDLKRCTIFLDKTKNGSKRQVGLSSVAVAALRDAKLAGGPVFSWWDGKPDSLTKTTFNVSRIWARVFDAAGCGDLHFHDVRHEATSRFYERTTLTDLEIARQTGHKDLRMLRRYANLRGSTLAGKLW